MSKLLMKTKDKIKARALELFNERGIEYVGVRELAADLSMRVSNITYYFPTKDHLVDALSADYRELNSQTFVELKDASIKDFMEMLTTTFGNQLQYRCMSLSLVHLITQNPMVSERYKSSSKERFSTIESNLKSLIKGRYIKELKDEKIALLGSQLGMILRFWILESVISFKDATSREQMIHYLKLIHYALDPYLTARGKESASQFFTEN